MAQLLRRTLLWMAALICFPLVAFPATGDEEVMLSFSHPAIGQYYIHAIYSNNTVFLPSMELFNLLYVHYENGSSGKSLQGTWLREDNPWQINVSTLQATAGKTKFSLTAEDFRLGELDLYLSPSLFEKMFGLQFTIDMGTLNVSLQTNQPLPVEEKKKHEQLRNQLDRQKDGEKDFLLLYPRVRKVAGAGMIDYNLLMYTDKKGVAAAYTLSGGMELLGGDLQGTVYGATGESAIPLRAGNLSWRYAPANNPYLTSFRAGQINTNGLQGQRIVGAAISNDPIEPRKVNNTYTMDGNTIPDSEVELYINNQLANYTRADELGYYRFDFPLTYGTVRINLRIYTPNGEIRTEERQIQIPFTFLPKGVVSYNLQGGVIDDGLSGVNFDRYAMHADIAWGLTNTLTAKVGTDYLSFFAKPLTYGGLSARLFDQYLLNADIAPNAFYRANASVTYASSRSFSLMYTKFEGDSLYNPHRALEQMDASLYLPFNLFKLPSGFRMSGEYFKLNQASSTNYNIDYNTRFGRFNVRTNYRDQLVTSKGKTYFGFGMATGSVTYTFSRTPGIPVFVRGMFMRAQAQYDVHYNQIATMGIQFSRTVLRTGRFNVDLERDLRYGATRVQVGFTLDLDAIRMTSNFTAANDYYAFQQSLNGSLGLDARSAKLAASNREQVGRAAVSVLMFVDSNNNSKYDAGEEKVPARALRLTESATFELGSDSILRITQLQNYWQYNAEVVLASLPNPNLVPIITEFSFVADPNRCKRIEIPLYHTGVIEGIVTLGKDGKEEGLGGIRLLLKRTDLVHEETVRTFSDGGFYAMNLLPGEYTIEADPAQLNILQAASKPEIIKFKVKAMAAGDYVEGLNFTVVQNINEKPSNEP